MYIEFKQCVRTRAAKVRMVGWRGFIQHAQCMTGCALYKFGNRCQGRIADLVDEGAGLDSTCRVGGLMPRVVVVLSGRVEVIPGLGVGWDRIFGFTLIFFFFFFFLSFAFEVRLK